jgi:hypothetical protein
MPGDRGNTAGPGRQRQEHPGRDKDHSDRPPPPGREPPVREQPHQDRDEDQPERRVGLERHRQPAKGQGPVMHPVIQHGVLARRRVRKEKDRKQHPPDQIPRAAGRYQGGQGRPTTGNADAEHVGRHRAGLIGKEVERHVGHSEHEYEHADRHRRHRCRWRPPRPQDRAHGEAHPSADRLAMRQPYSRRVPRSLRHRGSRHRSQGRRQPPSPATTDITRREGTH